MSEEEDIELTEDEISAVKMSLRVFVGLLIDVNQEAREEGEEVGRLEDSIKITAGIDEEVSLADLCLSALRKFGEEPDEELAEEF